MCGIWSWIRMSKAPLDYSLLYKDFYALKARGPDFSCFQTIANVSIGFHRLAIMDPTFRSNQPYILEDIDRTIIFIANGEIYNFKEIIKKYSLPITTNSDCMTIPQLYLLMVKSIPNQPNDLTIFVNLFKNEIKGEFAFILYEFDKFQNLKEVIGGRDSIGVRPLYYGIDSQSIIFSSEIKGTTSFAGKLNEFEPGNIKQFYWISSNSKGKFEGFSDYNFNTVYSIIPNFPGEQTEEYYLKRIRDSVINCVQRRLISEKPIAFLLSGGVDSSLVAALGARMLSTPINTFCCAISEESTDLLNARKVATHIGSHHTEIIVSEQEAIDKIRQVIYTTETWCTTTCRASIGQSIVCDYIGSKTDACVILCGEGPDEICSSYLHQWYAPNASALHKSAQEYLSEIHMYDGRRADRNISGASCEGRIPLLDPEFIAEYWKIPSEMRMPTYKNMEKWWLRKAFDQSGLLPDEILWRKKEAFSDGISSQKKSWFQVLQDFIATQVSDEEFQIQNEFACPTKEAYYYMKIFIELFGKHRVSIIPHYWQAKFKADNSIVNFYDKTTYTDPSARTLQIYKDLSH
jgi:asparagine synthase (glutamine-hydrolysing)